MTRQPTLAQQIKQAKQLARDHNMFVVDKGGLYYLYRAMPGRNVFIGMRTSAAAFCRFVRECAGTSTRSVA